MARHNIVILYGMVLQDPNIYKDDEGNYKYGMVYVNVVRGKREVGDKVKYLKTDHPIIMTKEPELLDEMSKWKANDMVAIKGTVASKAIKKTSYCSECEAKNSFEGTLVYVNPIFLEKISHEETANDCLKKLAKNREVSNQVYIMGELCRDPKKLHTKNGLTVSQYQIALNRKYRIRTDPPEIKSDYPWVKSYGENAVEDKNRLHVGSIVFIDGFLQARKAPRESVCACCGKTYKWPDNAMEIVPYETEYMPGTFYTDEEIAEMAAKKAEQARLSLFGKSTDDGQSDDDLDNQGYSEE